MVDFPRKKHQDAALKQQNEKLSTQFGIEGFPTVLLLDSDGNVLARTGYRPGGAEVYVKHLQDLVQKK
jgi:thioredoxin-related protein